MIVINTPIPNIDKNVASFVFIFIQSGK
jgi:hypothetical protein